VLESTPAGFCVFLSDPYPESKIWEKTDPESLFNFGSSRSLCGHYLSKNRGKLRLDRTGVWTGVGLSNLKNCRTRNQTRIQKFWNRSGFGVWKCDSGHLWYPPACLDAQPAGPTFSVAHRHAVRRPSLFSQVASVTFSDSDFAPVPKFLNLCPQIFQMWESDSCSDSTYHLSNRNFLWFNLRNDYVATLSVDVALNVWFTRNGMCAKNNNIYTWHEQAMMERLGRIISVVACCHSANLCAHAARPFRSQQLRSLLLLPKLKCDPSVKRNFWLAKFLTSHHVNMHRVIFYISNTLRKLMIRA